MKMLSNTVIAFRPRVSRGGQSRPSLRPAAGAARERLAFRWECDAATGRPIQAWHLEGAGEDATVSYRRAS